MSKRYGRNQKRKHREKIADLEAAYDRELLLISNLEDRGEIVKHKYNELIETIRRWWDNSVLVDPDVTKVNEFPSYYRLSFQQMFMPDFNSSTPMAITDVELHYQTLDALEIAFEKNLGDRSTHILLRVGNKSLKYYVDTRVFDVVGTPAYMKHYLHDRMGHAINQFIRGLDNAGKRNRNLPG